MNKVIPQQIAIPAGWKVQYNSFYDIEPLSLEEIWEKKQAYFNEDMLQLKNEGGRVLIDLGWYPSGEIDGQFILKVVRITENTEDLPTSWEKPLAEFISKNKDEVVTRLEEWLAKYGS